MLGYHVRCLLCIIMTGEWTGHWPCSGSVHPSQAAGSQVSFDHPMLLSNDSIVHALKMLGDSHYAHSVWFSFSVWANESLLELAIEIFESLCCSEGITFGNNEMKAVKLLV